MMKTDEYILSFKLKKVIKCIDMTLVGKHIGFTCKIQ